MRLTRLLAVFLITTCLSTASGAQDIIEGDLPVGEPFDGTGDRASMFDLYQVANITLSVLASGGSDTKALILSSLEDALGARSYPGTRIVALSAAETLGRSCSPDGTVEIRISRKVDQGIRVVVASEWWYSEGKTAVETSGETESFAHECQPIRQ